MPDRGTGGAGRALHEPDSLIRFAWSAQLDAHRRRTNLPDTTGRQALARALGHSEARLSTLANAGGDKLDALADALEQLGFAEHHSVSRLVDSLRIHNGHRFGVAPGWWPRLRRRHGLGDEEAPPHFDHAVDVVLAAEAFTAHYRHLLGGGPHVRSSIPAADLTACSQLLAVLCRLTTGPYGVSRDSLRLAARLTLLAPEVVADYVRLGGPRAQLVRAFERSARHAHWNAQVRQQFATLLARPPEIIDRRLDWLRGLRRLRLTDFASPETQATRRRWLHTQLLFAMRGEKGYAGARATERRYALWVAAEVTLDDASWQDVVTSAAADPLLTGLLPTVDQLRHHLARRAVHHRDAFWFTPSTGWPTLSSSSDVNEILGPYFVTKRTWSQHGTWSWARGATRWMAASLISDAVLAPCAVRQRSATDALVAGGEECREAASTTVAAVLAAERAGTRPHPVIVQRCLHLLGVLRHPAGIDAVQEVLRGLTPTDVAEILPVAITAAGDLAWAHPDDATGLEAWAARRASEHLDDEQVAVDAIRAFVAFRRDPVAELGARLPEGPGTRAALSWAAEVVGDPLGGPPPARSGSR